MDPKVVTTIIDLISSVCGKKFLLTVPHEEVHKYLGMTIDFFKKGKLNFTMND